MKFVHTIGLSHAISPNPNHMSYDLDLGFFMFAFDAAMACEIDNNYNIMLPCWLWENLMTHHSLVIDRSSSKKSDRHVRVQSLSIIGSISNFDGDDFCMN